MLSSGLIDHMNGRFLFDTAPITGREKIQHVLLSLCQLITFPRLTQKLVTLRFHSLAGQHIFLRYIPAKPSPQELGDHRLRSGGNGTLRLPPLSRVDTSSLASLTFASLDTSDLTSFAICTVILLGTLSHFTPDTSFIHSFNVRPPTFDSHPILYPTKPS